MLVEHRKRKREWDRKKNKRKTIGFSGVFVMLNVPI